MKPRETILNYLNNRTPKQAAFKVIVRDTKMDYDKANDAANLMVKRGLLTKYYNGNVVYAIK